MCKGKQLLVSLRDGLDLKICKDTKILNPIWLLQEFKILILEGRTGTLHVCWQWSLIAEWTGAVKRASVRRVLPLCSDIREPSVRWVEPTFLLWQIVGETEYPIGREALSITFRFLTMLGGKLSRWYRVRVSSTGAHCLKTFIIVLISLVVISSVSVASVL